MHQAHIPYSKHAPHGTRRQWLYNTSLVAQYRKTAVNLQILERSQCISGWITHCRNTIGATRSTACIHRILIRTSTSMYRYNACMVNSKTSRASQRRFVDSRCMLRCVIRCVMHAAAGRSHAPRTTPEANTRQNATEVPVFVNYLLFYPPTIPWVPDNMASSNE